MTNQSQVRTYGFLHRMLPYPFHHALLGRSPEHAMVGEMNPAKEIDAGGEGFDEELVRVEFELQFFPQEGSYTGNQALKPRAIRREKHEIVSVADVPSRPQSVFRELVKFVHINVYEKLGGEIAERESLPGRVRMEASYYFMKKPADFFIGNIRRKHFLQCAMIDIFEKLSDVTLQDPAGLRMVYARFPSESRESLKRPMCPLIFPAREGIGNENRVKERIKYAVDGVMEYAVPDARLVDSPRLGVGDAEGVVAAVAVLPREKVVAERNEVVHEPEGEFLNIRFRTLGREKLPPRLKEIFHIRDIFESNRREGIHAFAQ